MEPLTQAQRQYLRRIAHDLRPTAQVGKNGLTEQVVATIDRELNAHELIKVKFLDPPDEKRAIAEDLAGRLAGSLVAVIGNVAILYREQRDPQRRTIRLPLP